MTFSDKIDSALAEIPHFSPTTIIVSTYDAWYELAGKEGTYKGIEVLINPAAPEGIFYIR